MEVTADEVAAIFGKLDRETLLAIYVKVLEHRLAVARAENVELRHCVAVHEEAAKNGAP